MTEIFYFCIIIFKVYFAFLVNKKKINVDVFFWREENATCEWGDKVEVKNTRKRDNVLEAQNEIIIKIVKSSEITIHVGERANVQCMKKNNKNV